MTEARSAMDSPEQGETSTAAAPGGPSVALTIIAILLVFWGLYFAASLLIPIAAAVLLSMMLAPPVQFLERFHVPRPLASGLVVLSVMTLLAAGLFALGVPAKGWIERAPQSFQKIQQKLEGFTKPFAEIKKATEQLQEQTRPADASGRRGSLLGSFARARAPCEVQGQRRRGKRSRILWCGPSCSTASPM